MYQKASHELMLIDFWHLKKYEEVVHLSEQTSVFWDAIKAIFKSYIFVLPFKILYFFSCVGKSIAFLVSFVHFYIVL